MSQENVHACRTVPTLGSTIRSDPYSRRELFRRSPAYFAQFTFAHYLKNPTPEFHFDIYEKLSKHKSGLVEIIAFRGSGKSTIASLIFPLWSALYGGAKFIIICSDTFTQVKLLMAHIQTEIESNPVIVGEFGDLKGKQEWTATSMVLTNGVRIMGVSQGQKVRGLRHNEHRPDLIVLDDIENVESVRTKEQRDHTDEWIASDVFPALEPEIGKLVIVGSLLHHDSALARYKKKIINDKIGVLIEYPLFIGEFALWSERFPEPVVDQIKKRMGSRYYRREYMLEIIADEDQIVKTIVRYGVLPEIDRVAVAVDLAISQAQSADNRAIVTVGKGVDGKFYVLRCTTGRWSFNETLDVINREYKSAVASFPDCTVQLGVEDVAFQRSAIEEIQRRFSLPVEPIKQTTDKRSRLETLSPYFEQAQILFPEVGTEELETELLGFGVEPHDDTVDALEMAMRLLIDDGEAQIFIL
jgi:predicted phage terminase large subunit-like protein